MIYLLFSPEIYGLAVALVFLCLSMTRPDPRRDHTVALFLSAIGVAVCLAGLPLEGSLFSGTCRVDLFSQVFKVMLFTGLFLVICLCSNLNGIEKERHSEFYLLLFVCTLSMMLLVSSVHLLTLYVALELSGYSLYVLVFLRREREYGVNSGIKYFLTGASASAVMLFGLALIYGATGTAHINELSRVMPGMMRQPDVSVGLILTLCGFFFKLALFPFHFWAPDVYEGAANPVAAYVATASKVAAIAVLIRMVALGGGHSEFLAHGLAALAIISMTVGNLSTIVQKDLKRLLAFSSVAHGGYVMIGILSMNRTGYASAVFYALTILVLKSTCFLVVVTVADKGQNPGIDDLAGLHSRSPLLAMALMLALFGLGGIPPTIGFTGKLLLFTAAMKQGYFTLVLIAMINVVISLYYYLLVLKAAYLTEPEGEPTPLRVSGPMKVLTAALIAVMVMGGFYPNPLIELARAAGGLM
ncbi:NADH-quinone oxidoreductase subunit N [Desulfonema ishimotonii]|uniref:NADH-quinone oxidoreductase subunit N n=1 Tax=Desulfonema ishimotonii TaxID=45657 RepID=A0A401G075_9BACT|nr:NADH-quinone oxidoreductase subunit N [Desulfonema ishimotonii]GBC62610.1 NADH-quinone oxidoreductase subunit N [Desulfonema ishimotonii]